METGVAVGVRRPSGTSISATPTATTAAEPATTTEPDHTVITASELRLLFAHFSARRSLSA